MRRTGEIRTVRSTGYDEAMEIAGDLVGLVLSMAVMVFIVFLAGGWV
jgi:hypothetical protein